MGYSNRFMCRAFILLVQIHISFQSCKYVNKCERYTNGYCYNVVDVLECDGIPNYSDVWPPPRILHIYNGNIYKIQSKFLQNYGQLQELWMPNNNIDDLEPEAFEGLIHLNNLNLTKNKIQTISEGIFSDIHQLSVLDLSHNLITNIDNESFTGTDGLTTLYLNDNQISSVIALEDHCSNLKVLDLSNNRLNQLEFVSNCLNLEILNVAGNILDTFPMNEISETIKSLDFSDNSMSQIESEDLDNFNALEELNLSLNPLFKDGDPPVHLFQNMHSLKDLNLSYTSIENLSIGTFSGLLNLQVLDLSSNNLTSLPESIFHGLENLNELYIGNNRLSYFDSVGLHKLHKIGMDGNFWNCDLLLGILKKFDTAIVVRGSAYNTTNILGIACYEETKDFQEVDGCNASGINDLQKEYFSGIIKMHTDLRETFAELKTYLEQFRQDENIDSIGNKTNNILLDLEKVLRESMLHLKNIEDSVNEYKLDVNSLLVNLTNVFGSIPNVTNLIMSMENGTSLAKVIEMKMNISTMQTAELKTIFMKFAENYDTTQGSVLQTLIDIRNHLVSTKTELPPSNEKLLHTAEIEAIKAYPSVTVNPGHTIALYAMLIIQIAVFGLLALWYHRRYKKFRTKQTGGNFLKSLA